MEDNSIPTRKLSYIMYAFNADDSLNSTTITHHAQITVNYKGHTSRDWYYVTDLGDKTMIIGMTWLRTHNPLIDWRTGSIEFTRCPKYCGQYPKLSSTLEAFDVASILTEFATSEVNILCHSINAKVHASQEWAIEDYKNRKVMTLEDIKTGPFADYADVFEDTINHTLPP